MNEFFMQYLIDIFAWKIDNLTNIDSKTAVPCLQFLKKETLWSFTYWYAVLREKKVIKNAADLTAVISG